MTFKVKVNDLNFQYPPRVSQDVYLLQILWFPPKSVTSYLEDKVKFTDGQTQATTIPLRPERCQGNKRNGESTHVWPHLSKQVQAHMIAADTLQPWWRHQMETFSASLALCVGNSPVPVNSPHKGQWRGALMFSFLPLYKKGDKTKCDSYRPISLLCAISKLFEKVVYNQLYDYFTKNKLFHDNQYGFRTKH